MIQSTTYYINMNKIITKTVKIRGKEISVNDLKPKSQVKVTVECKHGKRELRWSRRYRLCKKCTAEAGIFNTCKKGRKITWGKKISNALKGKKFSNAHKKALSIAQYKCNNNEWPGFYSKSEIHKLRDSAEYLTFRKRVMERDNYKCAITGKDGNLQVHHLKSVNIAKDKVLEDSNAITLHASIHSKFHLIYGNGNNTIEQFEEFKVKFKPDKKLIFLCGQSGAGKTYISNKLTKKFEVIHYDNNKGNLIEVINNASASNKPILLDIPTLISTYYKELFGIYDIDMIFVIEEIPIIEERILKRGGKLSNSIKTRHKRMKSLSNKYGSFSGTSNKVLDYLNNLET